MGQRHVGGYGGDRPKDLGRPQVSDQLAKAPCSSFKAHNV